MKGVGFSAPSSSSAKRRWKGLVRTVLCLVFCSMFVPLFFLLGLHSSFHSAGYGPERQDSPPERIRVYDSKKVPDTGNVPKVQQSAHVDDLIKRLAPVLPKGSRNNSVKKSGFDNVAVISTSAGVRKQVRKNTGSVTRDTTAGSIIVTDENEVFCGLKFGSYCLWRQEHKEDMKDLLVKRMKDLLFVARAYYPSIAKLPKQDKLSQEMKLNIQDFERVLSEATTDKDLPPQIEKKTTRMESAIAKAKTCPVECTNVDKKFRQLVDLTEDESNFHMKQSAFLYKLAVQTMPKSLHCLSMRLTVEYFRSSSDIRDTMVEKFTNPELHHYVMFSTNILASSAVINSTALHAKESKKLVFHLLTDKENYFAMKFWFLKNIYGDTTVRVLNIEDLKLHNHYKEAPLHLSLPEEYRVSFRRVDALSSVQIRTEILSMFSHSHFLLPDIFPTLDKVVVLDDDIIVQKDLSALWDIKMGDKVNGAVQTCAVKLFDLKPYFSSSNVDEDSCAWTSGLNLINLSRWRKNNLSQKYYNLLHEMISRDGESEATKLSASLLTFHGLVYGLDETWMQSGLGYNYGVDTESITRAALLHFEGSMKPWLDLGIPKYRKFWRLFLNKENKFLSDCNVN